MNIPDEKLNFSRFGGCPGEDPGIWDLRILGVLASQPRRKGGVSDFQRFPPPVEPAPRGWGWEARKCWGDRQILILVPLIRCCRSPQHFCASHPHPSCRAQIEPAQKRGRTWVLSLFKIGKKIRGSFFFKIKKKKSGGPPPTHNASEPGQ